MNTCAPSIRFRNWARNYGMAPLARTLGVTRSLVYYWTDRVNPTFPRVENARRILELADGQLGWEDIYGQPPGRTRPLARSESVRSLLLSHPTAEARARA